jgi:ABC-type transport system involved in multi-copper enzyme maturation permease subunit
LRAKPWGLWLRQVLAILRLEIKKSFVGRRLIAVYLLSLAPVALLTIRLLLPLHDEEVGNPGLGSMIFAVMFQTFTLRFAIFFGCVFIFTNLFRGEVLEKTLHYYLLTPVRREVLVAGKFLSGWVASVVFFGLSVAVSFVLVFAPHGGEFVNKYFTNGPGLKQLAGYVAVTALGCLGYGAVFLVMGLCFRNPIVPAGVVLGWEWINFLLPPLLQKISVVHYLQSICPVAVPPGPLAVLVEPTSPWISVPGLLGLTVLVILVAGIQVGRLQITYGAD